jgi:signal peptidase I
MLGEPLADDEMPRDGRRNRKEGEPENFWKGLARDALIAGLIVALFLGALYLYAGVWPPLVVVESSSMQHGDDASSLGVIDTGDMVFQQAAPTRGSVITYLEGRASGYSTYGDYGDVIIFRKSGAPTPIIHRAIMYVTIHVHGPVNATADVPDILLLDDSEWSAQNASGPTRNPNDLQSLTIRHMGFEHNIDLTFNFKSTTSTVDRTGYVTMGDNNLVESCGQRNPCSEGYDPIAGMPRLQDIQGRARGEIPWFGLIKLTLEPTDSCCPYGWGSTGRMGAPKNSWDSLLITLIFLVALPFILEFAGRGWKKFVSPHLPKIPWPWRKSKAPGPDPGELGTDPDSEESEPPREGSSEP